MATPQLIGLIVGGAAIGAYVVRYPLKRDIERQDLHIERWIQRFNEKAVAVTELERERNALRAKLDATVAEQLARVAGRDL